MASGSFSKYPVSGFGLYCEWTSTANNSSNSSSVTVKVYLKHYSLYAGSRSDSKIVCNGTTYTYTVPAISTSNKTAHTTLMGSHTFTVNHNNDGKKSITISASWRFDGTYSGISVGTITASTTVNLDNIPRNSTIASISSEVTVNGSNSVSISLTRYSSSYTHKVKFEIGSYSYTAENVGTSTSYAIPMSWLNATPNSMLGVAKATVTTYSGSTQIGSAVSKNFNIRVPSNVVPTLEGISWNKTSSEPNDWGMTQNVSTGQLSMTGIVTAYNSPIKTYSLSFSGYNSTSSTLTIPKITTSGTLTATAKITDSRGQSATKTVSFTVSAYTPPNFSMSVFRCDSSGVADETGSYISAKVTANISSVDGKNSLQALTFKYRQVGGSYDTVNLTSGTARVVSASSDYSWEWLITATDKVKSTTKKGVISSEEVIIDILATGKGISIGKVATREGLDANEDWLPDWVVETGTASMGSTSGGVEYGTWTYRKWNSGVSECWGEYKDSVRGSNTSPWGALYTTANEFCGEGVNFPTGLFNATPIVNATFRTRGSTNGWLATRTEGGIGSKDKTPGYQIVRPTPYDSSLTQIAFSMFFHAIGRWK